MNTILLISIILNVFYIGRDIVRWVRMLNWISKNY